VNKDLADVLGNFVSRVTKFCRSRFDGAVPGGGAWGEAERALAADLAVRVGRYERHLDAIEIRKAAAELRALWQAGNEYLQAAAPWAAIKTEPDRAAVAVRLSLNLIRLYGTLSAPFVPDSAAALFSTTPDGDPGWPDDVPALLDVLAPGTPVAVPDTLFRKITDEEREAWQDRFAGGRG
jgi:methionyl-tRNA synthetase